MMPEEKLKLIKDAPTRYHFRTKDDQRVSIEHRDRRFVLGLHKWGEESSLEMSLNMVLSDKRQFLENKIELETPDLKLRAYPIDARSTAEFYGDSDDMTQCEDGGLRFELVLKAKPLVSSFTISIKSKNLRFSYQPFLTEQDIAEGISRPLNVEGSYAVYHATKKNNQYMTGKAFHIYRPIAEDALGNKAWCSLYIDGYIDPKNMTITVPQQFLDEAIYPVTVDPDLGYQSTGASIRAIAQEGNQSLRMGEAWTMPAGGGTANYIRAYLKSTDNTTPCDCTVFINQKDSGGAGTHGQIAIKENLACGGALHWEEFTLSDEALTAAVVYIFNIMGDENDTEAKVNNYVLAYDADGGVASYHEVTTYAVQASPWVDNPEAITQDYSIYCNYTAAPAVTEKTSSDTGSGADAKATGNPLATFPVRSETGGGVDGHKAVAPQSAGETGSGVDALTALLGILARSETGLGTDAKLSLAVALIKADAGSGLEHILDRALVLISESGSGLDVSHLVKTLMLTETGTGAENSYLHILEGVKDSHETGSGVDASTLSALHQRSDAGSGVDEVIARALYAREYPTGALDLAKVITAAITGAETGTGAEASLVAFYQKKSDSGSGADVSSLVALFAGEDSGIGVEAITLLAAMVSHDTGKSVEAVIDFFRKLIDSGEGEENLHLIGYVGRAMKLVTYLRDYSDLVVYTKPYSDLRVYNAEVKQA